MVIGFGHAHNISRHPASAKGNQDSFSHRHKRGKCLRDRVCKGIFHRKGDGDFDVF